MATKNFSILKQKLQEDLSLAYWFAEYPMTEKMGAEAEVEVKNLKRAIENLEKLENK